MPEGPLVHHHARRHARDLLGVVRTSSPQGRFQEARDPDGASLERVEAHGKHLFYEFAAGGGVIVHVHLGQAGLFLHHDGRGRAPMKCCRVHRTMCGWVDTPPTWPVALCAAPSRCQQQRNIRRVRGVDAP